MKIRSVTAHIDPERHDMGVAAEMLAASRNAFPFEVQTVRASVTPINGRYDSKEEALSAATDLQEWAVSSNVDYVGGFGLGTYPAPGDVRFLRWLPDIFDSAERIFSNCQVAWGKTVSICAARECSRLVKVLSMVEDGFMNLRFAGLYNCQPDNPFFPASYASGDVPRFSISIEGADIASAAFADAGSLSDARNRFLQLMRDRYCDILASSIVLEEEHGIAFAGMDFTLAPTPGKDGSIANALESLGHGEFGGPGTLFLSSFLSDCIKSLGGRIGFSGLMYPVMEDGVISERVSQQRLSIDSLLSYSSVCGTGLDCVPLPGNISERALLSLMMDVAGLSCRLGKPLTTRLFPVFGKGPGDMTTFDFPYFSNTRIMEAGEPGLLGFDEDEFRFDV
ncbi:MAG TPA: DUF711 family protein [Candidatus Methanofastidiosa archaeon]|nr:DUF711 family protein [Candidatus Methanofastidiosa archaeon]